MNNAPNGFHLADRLQVEAFVRAGSVPGASKVATAPDGALAVRLGPPTGWGPVQSAAKAAGAMLTTYIREYNNGWRSAIETTQRVRVGFAGVDESVAFWDGYRDRAENRMKWHLTYCHDHGDHESGCQV